MPWQLGACGTNGAHVHAIAKMIEFKPQYCGPSGKMCSSNPYSIVIQILAEHGIDKSLTMKRLKDAGVKASYPYKQKRPLLGVVHRPPPYRVARVALQLSCGRWH